MINVFYQEKKKKRLRFQIELERRKRKLYFNRLYIRMMMIIIIMIINADYFNTWMIRYWSIIWSDNISSPLRKLLPIIIENNNNNRQKTKPISKQFKHFFVGIDLISTFAFQSINQSIECLDWLIEWNHASVTIATKQ